MTEPRKDSRSDALLVLGTHDEKLLKFLNKIGYSIRHFEEGESLTKLISTEMFDLILLDTRMSLETTPLCDFLRSEESTKKVPIVVVGDNNEIVTELNQLRLDKVEVLPPPMSVGTIASRIATLLRLRKFAGEDELKATLGEMNARLRDLNAHFRKELEEAKSIQQGLLPANLPRDPRFEIVTSYQPLEEVGGDWFFVQTMPSGAISVQVADVTGHGLSAAFIGTMTKLALSAADKEMPNELLEGANRLMAPLIPAGKFVTMCAFHYDPATGRVVFARGGHPPGMLLKRKTKEVVQLQGDGFAVGFFEDSTYTAVEATLEVDDIFIVLTDGLTEAQNRSMKQYGFEGLTAALMNLEPGISGTAALESILEDFDTFRENRILKDDVTMILLKRTK